MMWVRLQDWLRPVDLPSSNETRIANLLRVILLTFFVLCSIVNPLQIALGLNQLPIPLSIAITIMGVAYLGLWQLVRVGYLRFVGWVVCLMSTLTGTVLIVDAGTILTPFVSTYFLVVILSALLLDKYAVFILTFLSASLLALLFYIQTDGQFVQDLTVQVTTFTLLAFSVYFLTAAVLMVLASNSITRTFASFLHQREELATKNAELQALRDSLAEEVTQRTEEAERAVNEAKQANTLLAEQIWLAIGQARLSDAMRGKPTSQELAQNVLQQMCQYLDVQVGNLFVYDQYHRRLDWQAGYAYRPSEETHIQFKLGEGVIGQVAKNKEPLLMRDLPSNYLSLITGTAVHETAEALIYPFLYNGTIMVVVELGRWHPFAEKEHLLLERIAESVAIAFYTAQTQVMADLP